MKGVHEDDVGSTYLYAVYHRGNIVRRGEFWGVVYSTAGNKYHSFPRITWLVDDVWTAPTSVNDTIGNISAPYAHGYAGIPDEVLAKATEIMLAGSE